MLDKSAFESLNITEIFFLHQYYFPIISHILIIEINADLKKSNGRDEKDRVQQLAHKILQLKPTYSMNYQFLIERELSGAQVEMSRRPIVGQWKGVISEDGKRGYVFDQPLEEAILQKWQLSEFSTADELAAESWRHSIEENIIELDKIDKPEILQTLKNLSDIVSFVEKYLSLPLVQKTVFENILSLYKINSAIASEVFYKLETSQISTILDFAPYTSFCYKIFLVFSLALSRGIITPRKTDIIDLQYLYYLPFTSIFASDDKFHKMFTPLFLENDQIFIPGTFLKADLKKFVEMRKAQNEEERDKWTLYHRNYPPEIESSFTSDLWKKNVSPRFRTSQNSAEIRSAEENEKIIEKIKKFVDSNENKEPFESYKDDETDFIVRKSKVGADDFCPCGSGKLFKDCHWSEVMKNKNT